MAIVGGRPPDAGPAELSGGNDSAVTPMEDPGHSGEEEFGIPSDNTFLRTVLAKVRAVIAADSEIKIEQVIHGQYRESYFFVKGESRCRIDISYNGKGKLSSLLAPSVSEFSTCVIGLLFPLKGTLIAVPTGDSSSERVLSKDFLREFDAKVNVLVTGLGARIDSVREQEWSLRYFFTREAERAVVDVYFNGQSDLASVRDSQSDSLFRWIQVESPGLVRTKNPAICGVFMYSLDFTGHPWTSDWWAHQDSNLEP